MNLNKSFNRQDLQFFIALIMQSIDDLKRRNLIRLIKRMGLQQRELARAVNTPPEYINNIIHARANLSDDMVDRICKEFNIKRYEFYIETEDELPATDLERKALFMARSAENSKLDYIAEEIVEYGNQRIERVKKDQKKAGIDKSRAIRLKAGSG